MQQSFLRISIYNYTVFQTIQMFTSAPLLVYRLFNSIKQCGSYSSRYAVGKQVSHVVEQTVLFRSVSKATHAEETGWQNGI